MKLRKCLSAIFAAILTFALCMPANALPAKTEVPAEEGVSAVGEPAGGDVARGEAVIDLGDPDAEHAYDPFAEIEAQEAEQEYRESCEIVEGTVLFTLRDWRAEDAGEGDGSYINDWSELARTFGLTGVEVVYETEATDAGERDGLVAWDVYYQAKTRAEDVWTLVDELSARDDVVSAEPDYLWGTQEVAQATAAEMQTASSWCDPLDIVNVWNSVTDNFTSRAPGYGTVVAVIDTGVDYTHPDLDANIWTNTEEVPGNGIDDDGNGYVDDIHGIDLIEMDGDPMDDMGHGTHVAGIIAMEANGFGGVGVAYGAKVMCIKAGQSTGVFASTDIAKAVKYAAANGADVINMSFGGPGRSTLVEAALADAFGTSVLVAAAGNNGKPTTDALPYIPFVEDIYPAGYSYVLGVMASDSNGNLSEFSNWDYIEGKNCEYEMTAPGIAIYSALPNKKYAYWSGTSMASPMVAGSAAVIRALHADKSVYSSRYIAGQLVGATQSSTQFVGAKKDAHSYPRLDLSASITKQPKPDLRIEQVYLFDGTEIDDANNGDGIIQAGETVDMGIVVHNRWGIASNVKLMANARSVGDAENPHVTFLKDSVELQDVGTFMSTDNEFTYEEEMLIGTSNPIRLKIDDESPNDLQITINLECSANNGMDKWDTATYSSDSRYTFVVQRGQVLHGVIDEDTTLTPDKLWIIDGSLLVSSDATLTVQPGTRIQFWSADSASPYANDIDAFIQVEGKMLCMGDEKRPIELFLGKGHEDKGILIYEAPDVAGLDAPYIKLSYTSVLNPWRHDSDAEGDHCFQADDVDHCVFTQTTQSGLIGKGATNYYYFGHMILGNVNSSRFVSLRTENNWHWYTSAYSAMKSTECLFYNCVFPFGSFEGTNSVFLLNHDPMWQTGYTNLRDPVFSGNAILNNLNDYTKRSWMTISALPGHENRDLTNNYWGTSNAELVKMQVDDADSKVNLNNLVQEPYLTLESPELETIYPFVTETYLTDAIGNRLDAIVGGQDVQLHVRFNRDMASDIQPMVSFGGSEPYTDYVVTGDWNPDNPREWVGEMSISLFINQGTQYIRVKDAAAADDKWLLTGTDETRFSFDITKVGALSMTLQGVGTAGRNDLTWVQDDYETLAGFNLYRTTSYDPSKNLSEQSFERINTSVITPELAEGGTAIDNITAYSDTAVEQGVDYYYYFTVVDTAFNESEPSNVVKCTPLDLEVPVIEHSVIASVAQGSSIAVRANVTDNVAVEGVALHYRMEGAENWADVPMRNTSGDSYQAVIGPNETGIGTLQYWIEATDGENVTTCGTAELPNQVAIADPVTVTSVSVAPASASMQVGEDLQLTAAVTPEGVTQAGLTWSTSDIAVATVAEDGTVTAQGPGKATITCTSANGKEGQATITVRKRAETTLSVGTVNAAPGETVEVPVTIDKNCGIAGMKLAFSYDPDRLALEGVEAGPALEGATLINGAAPAGKANVVWYSTSNLTADGELMKLKVTVKDGVALGTSTPIGVAYGPDDITDADYNYLDVNTSAGMVSVKEPLLGDVYEDGKLDVRDPILLQRYLTNLEELSLHQLHLADMDGSGTVGMADLVALGVQVASAPLGTQAVPQMLTLGAESDPVADLAVTVGSEQLVADGKAVIPVDFVVGDKAPAALRFTVSYDGDAFRLANVTAGDALKGGSLMFNDLGGGRALVTWYNASGAAASGRALSLEFESVGISTRFESTVALDAASGDVVAKDGTVCTVKLENGVINNDPEAVGAKLVAATVAAINAIGFVETDENGEASPAVAAAIDAARVSYDALTTDGKNQVSNYGVLLTAEKKLVDDKAAAERAKQFKVDLEAAVAAQKAADDEELAKVQQQAADDLAASKAKEQVKLAKAALTKKTKSAKKGKVTVAWKRVAKASGYQVKVGSKTYTAKGGNTLKKTVSAKKGAKVKVMVRAYKKIGSNTLYGPWSKAKTVTVRKK